MPDCNENLVNLFSGGTGNNYSTLGRPGGQRLREHGYAYNDDFTWIHGKHTFKFGGMFQINHYNGFGRQCEAGCVGFSYQETGVPGGSNPTAGGNAFASFLLGWRIAARSIRCASSASSSTMSPVTCRTTGVSVRSWC